MTASSASSMANSSPSKSSKCHPDDPPFLGGSPTSTHLVVLIHGLWGQAEHMHSIAQALRARYSSSDVFLHSVRTMGGTRTYDGVAQCGERACAEVEGLMEDQRQHDVGGFRKISFVGYSMGGLVARYVVGLLEAKGVLAGMECMTFATFASPHLGARAPKPTLPLRLWNLIASSSIGEAGDHLFLNDTFRDTSRPLLSVMADPSSVFIAGLRRFYRLTTYGNIVNDRAVVWHSTAFSATDPFADLGKVAVKYVPGYEGVILEREGAVVLRDPKQSEKGDSTKRKRRIWLRRGKKEKVVKTADEEEQEGKTSYNDKDPYEASWPWNMRMRIVTISFVLITLWPLLIPLLGTGSTAITFASRRRMRRHDDGLDGIDTHAYRRLKLFADGPVPTTSANDTPTPLETDETTAPLADVFPSLNLPPVQLDMIKHLDALPWRKYPVWIRRHANTHEDVVVRNFGTEGTEGELVLRHFATDEFWV